MQQHEEAEESPNSGERHLQALVGVEVEEPTFPLIQRVQVREPLVNNMHAQRRRYLRYLNRMTQTTWEGSLTGTLSHQGKFKTAICSLANSTRRLPNRNIKPTGRFQDRDAVRRTAPEGFLTETSSHRGRFKTAMLSGEQHSKAHEHEHQALGEASRP